MKKLTYIFLTVVILSGCTTSGAFLSLNQTQVNLEQANYQIVATGVSGQAESGYILGISYSTGLTAMTLAVARVTGSGMLYKEALDDLWITFEKNHGTLDGKRLALTNVRYDADILNLILYSKVKIGVRADIIEFTD